MYIYLLSSFIFKDNFFRKIKLKKITTKGNVIFELIEGAHQYFGKSESRGKEFIDLLLDSLNNKFILIPFNRFLQSEKDEYYRELPFTPQNFKRTLFNFSTSEIEEEQKIFKEISHTFLNLYDFGEISFSRTPQTEDNFVGNLDILIRKNNVYLPIGYYGTGVQQLLILLSNIIYHKKKIIGIEEIELNLSPYSQKLILLRLKKLVNSPDSPIEQIFLTSHSEHLSEMKDYYFVTAKDSVTSVDFIKSAEKHEESKKYFKPTIPQEIIDRSIQLGRRHKY